MRARSSSFGMNFIAIERVCSGVSACFVSGTSLPSMRARNTSPALMCRSLAPRSTAALMIFSISVSGVLVYEIAQRGSGDVSRPIVQEQGAQAAPEQARRNPRHVRRQQHLWKVAERTIGRQRFVRKNVERGAPQPPAPEGRGERRLVNQGAPADVADDRSRREHGEAP